MANLLIQQDPSLARRQRLAEAMLQRGQRQGPVKHWTEGLSRVLDTGMGAYFGNKAAQEQSDRQKKAYADLAQAISGTGMAADGMGPPQPLMSRIASVEGVNPEAIAMMKLQQAMTPAPRDPVADYRAKKQIDAELTPKERKIIKDASGRQRYADTKEFVFDDVGESPDVKNKQFDQEKGLRGEFQKITKDFRSQQEAFGRVLASAEDPSAAGDLSLIFNYMKTLDPSSVVRESEFATAAATGSFGERIQGAVNKVLNGERLSEAQRADFVSRSAKLYEEGTKGFQDRIREYQGLSESYEVQPERVVSSKPLYKPEDYAELLKVGTPETPPTPMNDQAYNALPSGAIYIDPDDGKPYRKP